MGFTAMFGPRSSITPSQPSSASPPHHAQSVSRETTLKSTTGDLMEPEEVKVAVATYGVQRRVLETLHDALQASLREEHALDLKRFKRSLKDQAFDARCARLRRRPKGAGGGGKGDDDARGCHCPFRRRLLLDDDDDDDDDGGRVLSACSYVHQKLATARFMVQLARERARAAKEGRDQLEGLRREYGDWVAPARNGGVREGDCARQTREVLAGWGLVLADDDDDDDDDAGGEERGRRRWEDDLRDMVRLSVGRERDERARRARRQQPAAPDSMAERARRISACTRPRRLSVISESSDEQ
ncbi:hypothetical protein CTA2_525 [Colletotrichum tanaceti]|uniref:Uncharacterized protein n=1 Tax=Colletotrichum tanaceti TaxID=1306861 RepID=A0A4U6WZ52_9PEZI|nr:hypothetical protein CTA2_525 [Colletotrichum tanaceti]TKW48432.1 hypothetical protein CTA1_10822 [Colletotrichum tanaceti]